MMLKPRFGGVLLFANAKACAGARAVSLPKERSKASERSQDALPHYPRGFEAKVGLAFFPQEVLHSSFQAFGQGRFLPVVAQQQGRAKDGADGVGAAAAADVGCAAVDGFGQGDAGAPVE
ncbi:hypothetical protein D9M71_245150 [compost metagenome]